MTAKAVFIDRDGVLNRMCYDPVHGLLDSPRRASQVEAVPGAGRFLARVRAMGFRAVVVTNQPGLAKGTLTLEDLSEVNARLAELLAREGGVWDALRFCPHSPDLVPGGRPEFVLDCACRKPKPGMLLDEARESGINLAQSWMVGDGLTDVQAGRAAGCRTILIAKLKIEQVERFFDLEDAEPDFVENNLDAALISMQSTDPAPESHCLTPPSGR